MPGLGHGILLLKPSVTTWMSAEPRGEKALQWGVQTSIKIKSTEDPRGIYESYYDFEFKINRLKPHQILAMNRGEKDKVLRLKIHIPERDWRLAIKNEYPDRQTISTC